MLCPPRWFFSRITAGALACVGACHGVQTPRSPYPSVEWPVYGGDAGASRYTSAAQVASSNVASLQRVWVYQTGASSIEAAVTHPKGKSPNFEATPIVVDGSLYFSTPLGRVIALDPERGAERWTYDARVDTSGNYGDFANRGVATWLDLGRRAGDRCRRRIFLATIDARLIALDAATGQPCKDFGSNGTVYLTRGLPEPPEYLGEYEQTSPPTVVNGLVVVGFAGADNNRIDGPRGTVRAFDARSGVIRWSWEPIPSDSMDPAWRTWIGPRAHRTGGAKPWSVLTADPSRDMVYVPTSSATTEFYGGERLGANVYANSVIALRASTGERLWHFQLVHHDLWDYDVAAPPTVVSLERDGRRVPAVLQTGKTTQLFVLDRISGRPLFPVEERPVPRSTVPGERSWPTQPFSTTFGSLSPVSVAAESAWGPTPAERATCGRRIAALRNEGIFTPPSLEGTIVIPSNIGGPQWGGLAFDSVRQVAVIPVNRTATVVQLIPRIQYDSTKEESDWQYTGMTGTPYVVRRQSLVSGDGWPCTPPPFGALVAVSLETGRTLWTVPLGSQRANRAAEGVDDPAADRWGTSILGGPIITASGLVVVAGTNDRFVRAFDITDGRELWRGQLPGRGKATPMTYEVRGRQYLVVAAGGDALADSGAAVVAFALPERTP
jgi:quinoprotein glucose dehydrogenase